MTLIHSAGELNHLPALFTCHLIDEANGPIAKQLQRVCHNTLPWLISVSLDEMSSTPRTSKKACVVIFAVTLVMFLLVTAWLMMAVFAHASRRS
ncbi:MAG TPA: hypothetical protein VE176_09570, partial [Candidatus Limnocylindrales bacterium]|nr:hypothetical protein [Candidatus Limnocylindrales bacterium]